MTEELRARHDRLAARLAELQWDLGGLTYEMAIRDHFRLDVLVRVAAELQRLEGELGQLERLMKSHEAGAAGSCPACGALHGRGAVYCWQCGTQLQEEIRPAAEPITAEAPQADLGDAGTLAG
jgi:hypothetical protein